MIEGKKRYEEIPIPDNVSDALEHGCRRGKRTIFRRRAAKAGATLAACLCLVVFTGNETVYATLSEVPVIGSLVQMIHHGQGGEITDGASGYGDRLGDRIQVKFEGEREQVPHYDVTYFQMPSRIQVTLDGVREFDREGLQSLALQTEGVRDIYFVTYLDDSAVRFVIELEDGYGYDVKEYQNPGYLEISLANGHKKEDRPVWVLRSQSMDMGEPLAAVQEAYMDQNASVVKTEHGSYTVVLGLYDSEEEAVKALEELGEEGLEWGVQMESGTLSGRPE